MIQLKEIPYETIVRAKPPEEPKSEDKTDGAAPASSGDRPEEKQSETEVQAALEILGYSPRGQFLCFVPLWLLYGVLWGWVVVVGVGGGEVVAICQVYGDILAVYIPLYFPKCKKSVRWQVDFTFDFRRDAKLTCQSCEKSSAVLEQVIVESRMHELSYLVDNACHFLQVR